MKSIMGKVLDCRESWKWGRVLRASGWNPKKAPKRYTGYHKQMPKADLKALAFRLQRQALR